MSIFRCYSSRRALRLLNHPPRSSAYHPTSLSSSARCFSNTTPTLFPKKNAQDKDSLDPSSSEYSKSGTDDQAAQTDAAFDPSQTRPETEEHSASKETGGEKSNPLNASPGNPEVSKPRKDQEGGSDHSPRTSSSGGGSAPKSGGGKSG